MAADAHPNQQIAVQCGVSSPAITHWKTRVVGHRLAGVHDEARPGHPREPRDEAVAQLLHEILALRGSQRSRRWMRQITLRPRKDTDDCQIESRLLHTRDFQQVKRCP